MLKNLYIVGAGGFGREVYAWTQDTLDCISEYEFSGFLDDNPNVLEGFEYPKGVVGSVMDFNPSEPDRFIIAIGMPSSKRKATETLLAKGARFETIVHPSVVRGSNVNVARGAVVCPGVILSSDSQVGEFAGINMHATLSHDVKVGAFSQLSSYCDLTGAVEIGEGVFLGSHSSVLPSLKVGDCAFVGAGAVCTENVSERSTVVGVPAKVVTK
ncbi:MAG: acetyltransferase [Opitutae bacterium]|nr:acetyltransferase [Opitutae bacterium]